MIVLIAQLLQPLHEFVLVLFGKLALALQETLIISRLLQLLLQRVNHLLLPLVVLVVLSDLLLQPVFERLHLH